MFEFNDILLATGILLILSIIASRVSSRFGIPVLLIFLGIGMLAGVDGPVGIYFDNAWLAQSLGITALIFILFSGGLETEWKSIRPVIWQGGALSTIGVALSAFLVGAFVHYYLGLSLLEGVLLGAIISSTDAAAVFSILGSKNINFRGHLKPLLELESGSNDPMAVFLTLGITGLLVNPELPIINLIPEFFLQMGIGILIGILLARGTVFLLNYLKLEYEGLFAPLLVGIAVFIYAIASMLKGNGFVAVYLAGLVIGNSNFLYKRSLIRFQNSLAWLFQIIMFLILGLLVYPSHVVPVIEQGLVVALFLMFVARPVSVFLSLLFAKLNIREKLLISWVGLRGAVPIILATFPLLADLPNAEVFFNIVFFIVITSSLLQGTLLPKVSKALRLDVPLSQRRVHHIELQNVNKTNTRLEEFIIPYHSQNIGKRIIDLQLPKDSLVMLIYRENEHLVPVGATEIEGGDVLLILINEENAAQVSEVLAV